MKDAVGKAVEMESEGEAVADEVTTVGERCGEMVDLAVPWIEGEAASGGMAGWVDSRVARTASLRRSHSATKLRGREGCKERGKTGCLHTGHSDLDLKAREMQSRQKKCWHGRAWQSTTMSQQIGQIISFVSVRISLRMWGNSVDGFSPEMSTLPFLEERSTRDEMDLFGLFLE